MPSHYCKAIDLNLINVLAQFQNPRKPNDDKTGWLNRCRTSVREARRHLGYLADYTGAYRPRQGQLPPPAPPAEGTCVIGVTAVARNKPRRLMPMAMRFTWGQRAGEICLPDQRGQFAVNWLPYAAAGPALVHRREASLDLQPDQVTRWLAGLIQSLDLARPMILIVPGRSLRRFWPWLDPEKIEYDRLRLDQLLLVPTGAPFSARATPAPGLRVVWYSADDADESAFYSTFRIEPDGASLPGDGHGVWHLGERHYVSIAPKADTYQPATHWTRLEGQGREHNARAAQAVDIVPAFVQPGDDLYSLAGLVHTLRWAQAHRTQGFTTDPFPVHLAETLANDYLDVIEPPARRPGQTPATRYLPNGQ